MGIDEEHSPVSCLSQNELRRDEQLPSMHQALGSILSSGNQKHYLIKMKIKQ